MGLYNRAVDTELAIVASTAVTTTATTTALNVESVGCGDADINIMFDVTALAGTHDASNHYAITVEASETLGGTYYVVDGISFNTLVTGAFVVGINTRQITDAVGSQDAAYYRLVVTKVGSTATGITLSANFAEGV